MAGTKFFSDNSSHAEEDFVEATMAMFQKYLGSRGAFSEMFLNPLLRGKEEALVSGKMEELKTRKMNKVEVFHMLNEMIVTNSKIFVSAMTKDEREVHKSDETHPYPLLHPSRNPCSVLRGAGRLNDMLTKHILKLSHMQLNGLNKSADNQQNQISFDELKASALAMLNIYFYTPPGVFRDKDIHKTRADLVHHFYKGIKDCDNPTSMEKLLDDLLTENFKIKQGGRLNAALAKFLLETPGLKKILRPEKLWGKVN